MHEFTSHPPTPYQPLSPYSEVVIPILSIQEEEQHESEPTINTTHITAPDDRREEALLDASLSSDITPPVFLADNNSVKEEPSDEMRDVSASSTNVTELESPDPAKQPDSLTTHQPLPEAAPEPATSTDDLPPPEPPLPTLEGTAAGEDREPYQTKQAVNDETESGQAPVPQVDRDDSWVKGALVVEGTNAAENAAAHVADEMPTSEQTYDSGEFDRGKPLPEAVRKIDIAAEPGVLNSAARMVAEQLLEDEREYDAVLDIMQGEDWHNLGLFNGDQLIGVASVSTAEAEGGDAYLGYLVVATEHRGKDLGAQLLRSVEALVVGAGATGLQIDPIEDLRAPEHERRDAKTFFDHHGYSWQHRPSEPWYYRKDLPS